MKRSPGYLLLVAILSILSILIACSEVQSVKTNPYDGESLTIGIVGEIPEVYEEQVTFEKIQFCDLEKGTFDSQYDAVFITKDNLSEAAQNKYKSIYKKSKIPFFFIQTKKSYVPFTEEDLSYEEVPEIDAQTYAAGIIYNDNNLKFWGYGLYNDIENKENIKDVYSRIFETISKNKK